MGLLKESNILTWEETEKRASVAKKRGAEYFIQVYHKNNSFKAKEFLWGEEIEQNIIVKIQGNWILLLGVKFLLDLAPPEGTILHPEYAEYMLESTPDKPYSPGFKEIGTVEKGFEKRRKYILAALEGLFGKDASILFLPSFPLLGMPLAFGTGDQYEANWKIKWSEKQNSQETGTEKDQLDKKEEKESLLQMALSRAINPSFNISQSVHFPDFAITSHNRYTGITGNIEKRRSRDVLYTVPLARIERSSKNLPNNGTQQPIQDKETESASNHSDGKKDTTGCATIDSMGQGMGCCCLQITMQSESLTEARIIYDNIGAICPLLLFLTMGTPYAEGKLVETSTRWGIAGASVDCRKASESLIKKSRYSSIDLYVSNLPDQLDTLYNDISPPLERTVLDKLLEEGVDRAMANHIASLYIRDPVLCYSDSTPGDDFENIQSTNWRSMRLKPPKLTNSSTSSWLVEVRPMELQPTSFENTAYSVFVIIFSRMVLSLNTSFYLPISKVDCNFKNADRYSRNLSCLQDYIAAEKEQEFWYRANIFDSGPPVIKKGTVQEIFMGDSEYIGILGAVEKYLNEYEQSQTEAVAPYLQFIKERVTGKKTSLSTFIRKFVSNHAEYKGDSVISQAVSNSLIEKILSISHSNSPNYLNATD